MLKKFCFIAAICIAVSACNPNDNQIPAQTKVVNKNQEVAEGWVNGFILQPGRSDFTVEFLDRPNNRRFYTVLSSEGGVTFQGKQVATAELMAKLVSVELKDKDHWLGVHAVLHPRIDRFGASTQAEFTVRKRSPIR